MPTDSSVKLVNGIIFSCKNMTINSLDENTHTPTKKLRAVYTNHIWKWKCQSLSHVWLFATPWIVACQAPLSTGILQARILEWVAIPFSRGSSQRKDQTWVSWIVDRFFTSNQGSNERHINIERWRITNNISWTILKECLYNYYEYTI